MDKIGSFLCAELPYFCVMFGLEKYHTAIVTHLESLKHQNEPRNLYEPIEYILDLGGKRLRPVLTLMTCDLFGGSIEKSLDAALAIEVFHNFTLVHDDIMDDAPLRRGKTTVHEKWDVNTGILSGDAMLILAYQLFEGYDSEIFKSLISLFSQTALEVCEGQQYDVDFETRNDVTIDEYLKMIEYKTAVLIGAAMQMGALIAGASEADQKRIYDFGKNLGIAFQLQDDYLDAFGDSKSFGKQVGGDIIENKKTYLYLKALEYSNDSTQQELLDLYNEKQEDVALKVEKVKTIFNESGAQQATKDAIASYTQLAYSELETLNLKSEERELLIQFGEQLMNRQV